MDETAEETAAYIESGDPNTSGPDGEHVPEWTTCGTCGRTWDDARITDITPVPSASVVRNYMAQAEKAAEWQDRALQEARDAGHIVVQDMVLVQGGGTDA